MIENGMYTARAIFGSEQYSADSKGELLLAIDMQFEGGEAEGTVMTATLSFSGKAAEYSVKKLRAMGWTGNDVSNLDGIDATPVQVRVFTETFDGKSTQKCDIAIGGGGTFRFKAACDDRQKKAFAAKYRGIAAGIPIDVSKLAF